jgi:hypothetical protein
MFPSHDHKVLATANYQAPLSILHRDIQDILERTYSSMQLLSPELAVKTLSTLSIQTKIVPSQRYTMEIRLHKRIIAPKFNLVPIYLEINPRLNSSFIEFYKGLISKFLEIKQVKTSDRLRDLLAKVKATAFTAKETNFVPVDIMQTGFSDTLQKIILVSMFPGVLKINQPVADVSFDNIDVVMDCDIVMEKVMTMWHCHDYIDALEKSNILIAHILLYFSSNDFKSHLKQDWFTSILGVGRGRGSFSLTRAVYEQVERDNRVMIVTGKPILLKMRLKIVRREVEKDMRN